MFTSYFLDDQDDAGRRIRFYFFLAPVQHVHGKININSKQETREIFSHVCALSQKILTAAKCLFSK